MKKFTDIWLGQLLKSSWHWYRYEFQHRGSVHLHGLAKLQYAPDLQKLIDEMLSAKEKIELNTENEYEENQKLQNAEKHLCNFADWLIDATNPNPPPLLGNWAPPQIHPCQIDACGNNTEDYANLCNQVQTHNCAKKNNTA